jgi:NAD(P)-dependent dehydrogenase (short-subunit alcohol dehydrogenase family)
VQTDLSGQPNQGQRVALVTGGTSGIGRAIAMAFADAGYRVVVTGRTSEETQNFHADGHEIIAERLDVSDDEAIRSLVSGLARLDVLVNSAGTILRGGREHDPIEFAKVVDVNLNGTMRMCAACRALLVESRGCVVNIASMLSFFGSGFVPAYSASKGGIAQLTKSLAIAWAPAGVRVNAIAPGWIDTPFTAPLRADPQRHDEIVRRTPLGRWGQPDDIAGAALFLCSPSAAFITGVILPVDGGYSIA